MSDGGGAAFLPCTLGDAYRRQRNAFRQAGLASPDTDARQLAAAAAGLSVDRLFLEDQRLLQPDELERLDAWGTARLEGKPVGRILGRRTFWGLDLRLNEDTLEPRPDTEILVEAVLENLATAGRTSDPLRFADLGTGTGAIALALLSELPSAHAIACDISGGALDAAQENARANGLAQRVSLVRGSYAAMLGEGLDFIVSNPPYIRDEVIGSLDAEVRLHDPVLALSGGEDGLAAYRVLIPQAHRCLQSREGSLYLEIGYDQGVAVSDLCRLAGFEEVRIVKDLAAHDRVVVARV